jgi:hypothetical protein
MFALVNAPNLRAPSLLKLKPTAGGCTRRAAGWRCAGRAGHRRHAPHRVVHGPGRLAGLPRPRTRPGMIWMSGGTVAAIRLRAAASSGNGPCSTSFSSSSAVDRMISFARFTSVTPGSCTRIWSAGAVARHDGLGDAQLVDAALDGLQRLIHRALAVVDRDVRLHLERVAPRRCPTSGRRRARRRQRAAERRILIGRHAGDREGGRPVAVAVAPVTPRRAQLLAQLVGRALGQQPQRIVGLHAQHQCTPPLRSRPRRTF